MCPATATAPGSIENMDSKAARVGCLQVGCLYALMMQNVSFQQHQQRWED